MTRVLLGPALSERLQSLPGVVELCDSTGKVLGQFFREHDLSGWEAVTPEPTEEELAEAERSTERYSTEEVLRHLNSLE
jgi:hypothetical protein